MPAQSVLKKFTITTALPYANGPIHIGHLAGVYVPADIYARYLRLTQNEVLLIGGSDEHGIPITIRAKKEHITPQDIVDKYHQQIKTSFDEFGITFDIYGRTSDAFHHTTSQDFFKTLFEKGKFIEETTEQYFDETAGEFLADRYIVGTCPKCGNENAYGDQCEKCGTTLSPNELINPKSALSGGIPVLKSTKNWYLPLNEYDAFLKEWILEGHKADWKSNVYGQVKSWVDEGLKPRAMTRDLNWGVPVPLHDAEGKVMYVWFDAPIGYISFTQQWAKSHKKNWKDYWQNDQTQLIHFIGKDNIVFHCIVFPIMLKAHGDYIMPTHVPANEFMNLENDKISTSRNWAVWLHEYLKEFPNQQDVLRYVLTANMPESKDNNFTWQDFQTKNNSELVGILGNFVNRVVSLIHQYFNGQVPDYTNNEHLLSELVGYGDRIGNFLKKFEFRNAQAEMIQLARMGNQYLQQKEPWKQIKTDEQAVKTTLYTAVQIVGYLSVYMEPFLPFTANKLRQMIGIQVANWQSLPSDGKLINVNHNIQKPEILFSKIEDIQISKQLDKLQQSKKMNLMTNPYAIAPKSEITFDDFSKIDLRIGTILEAKKVEKTDKLLELKVDTGVDVRTIVSGIAESFEAESIIGKKVMVLLNLTPRKIKGIESQGMLLFSDGNDGKLTFINPENDTVNGASIG